MKFKKTLMLLAAGITGAGLLATVPVSAAEYSTSFSGNVRVEAQSVTAKVGDADAVTTLSTGFGGDDEESSTGGDTYLQWNHAGESDNGAASGFIRFTSDGLIRINVAGSSELGGYKGEIKAEWERNGFGGVGCSDSDDVRIVGADDSLATNTETDDITVSECDTSVTERDQFVKLSHTGSGVYYKIGREEWLGNQKGYTSDFQSGTKDYADAGFGDRYSSHALGWAGNGIDVALLIQRDNGGSASGKPYGLETDVQTRDEVAATASAAAVTALTTSDSVVNSFGIKFAYAAGPVDVGVAYGSGSTKGADQKDSVSITELQLALTFGSVKPFLNFGSRGLEDQKDGGAKASDIAQSGWNLGVSVNLGASDIVIAYVARPKDK